MNREFRHPTPVSSVLILLVVAGCGIVTGLALNSGFGIAGLTAPYSAPVESITRKLDPPDNNNLHSGRAGSLGAALVHGNHVPESGEIENDLVNPGSFEETYETELLDESWRDSPAVELSRELLANNPEDRMIALLIAEDDSTSVQAIAQHLQIETDVRVIRAAFDRVRDLASADVRPLLEQALRSDRDVLVSAALDVAADRADPLLQPVIEQLTTHNSPIVREQAALAIELLELPVPDAGPANTGTADSPEFRNFVRSLALASFGSTE